MKSQRGWWFKESELNVVDFRKQEQYQVFLQAFISWCRKADSGAIITSGAARKRETRTPLKLTPTPKEESGATAVISTCCFSQLQLKKHFVAKAEVQRSRTDSETTKP